MEKVVYKSDKTTILVDDNDGRVEIRTSQAAVSVSPHPKIEGGIIVTAAGEAELRAIPSS